jgi:polysaccharide biosynthesis/export protein
MTHPHSLFSLAVAVIAAGILAPGVAAAQGADRGAAASSVATAASAAKATDYRLAPGDKLRIDVYKDEQLSQSVQIRPDGKITMPLVGDVAATGLTPLELRDRLTTSMSEYVNKPVITVVVVEATAPTAYVVGEVNRPGSVIVQGNMTILQAIAMVGGLKDFADEKNIRILRKNGTGLQTLGFDYKAAMRGTGDTVYLMPGDTIVVPD